MFPKEVSDALVCMLSFSGLRGCRGSRGRARGEVFRVLLPGLFSSGSSAKFTLYTVYWVLSMLRAFGAWIMSVAFSVLLEEDHSLARNLVGVGKP